jgi:polysaccharide biosynthesis/export protein
MKKRYLILISLFVTTWSFAQNMSNVDLTKLSPEQIQMYKQYTTKNSGSTTSNLSDYEVVGQRGLADDSLKQDDRLVEKKTKSRVFGMGIFNSQKLTFEPKLNIATPQNYILGTYDEVLVDISGLYDANYKLKVSPEGNIRIPNVGQIKVSGRTIEDATRRIKSEISKYFQGVSSGETHVNVSLGNIRSIKVMVVGEAVKPGTYTLPSLATAFNVLYACGGPTESGSMRSIKVVRAGKIIGSLDVYGMLIDEIAVNDIALQDGDIIRIEPYKNRIYVDGSVKRPGTFETLMGENLQKVLNFAGNFSEKADKSKIRIFRYTKDGRTVVDVTANQLANYIPDAGDSVYVSTMYEQKIGGRVTVSGAVKKPGKYLLSENAHLKDILLKAQGFTDIAYTDSIEIIRSVKNLGDLSRDEDKSLVIKVNVAKDLLNIDEKNNPQLEDGDQVVVRKLPGFEDIRMVRVEGEVKLPGTYNIKNKSERISDVLARTGGLTNYAYAAGAFLIRSESTNEIEQKLNQIIRTNSLNQLGKKQNKSIDLNMLKNSGSNALESVEAADSLQKKLSGQDAIEKMFSSENVVGVDIDFIMKNIGSAYDLKLEEGDIIYVPREQQTVKVLGQVLFPTIVCYNKNYRLKDYVLDAGGFADNASKKNIFVLYANGSVKGTKKFLFFRSYPRIEPGAQLVIPEKPVEIKNKMTAGETVGMLTTISSMLVLIYTLLK